MTNNEPRYRVLIDDIVYGPMIGEKVVDLISNGRVKPTDRVSKDGGPWSSLTEYFPSSKTVATENLSLFEGQLTPSDVEPLSTQVAPSGDSSQNTVFASDKTGPHVTEQSKSTPQSTLSNLMQMTDAKFLWISRLLILLYILSVFLPWYTLSSEVRSSVGGGSLSFGGHSFSVPSQSASLASSTSVRGISFCFNWLTLPLLFLTITLTFIPSLVGALRRTILPVVAGLLFLSTLLGIAYTFWGTSTTTTGFGVSGVSSVDASLAWGWYLSLVLALLLPAVVAIECFLLPRAIRDADASEQANALGRGTGEQNTRCVVDGEDAPTSQPDLGWENGGSEVSQGHETREEQPDLGRATRNLITATMAKALDVWKRAPTLVIACGVGLLLLSSSCCICGGFFSSFVGSDVGSGGGTVASRATHSVAEDACIYLFSSSEVGRNNDLDGILFEQEAYGGLEGKNSKYAAVLARGTKVAVLKTETKHWSSDGIPIEFFQVCFVEALGGTHKGKKGWINDKYLLRE